MLIPSILVISNAMSPGNVPVPIARLEELQKKAQQNVDDEIKKRQQAEEQDRERRAFEAEKRAALERQALIDAKKKILGTWRCSTGTKFTFNPDATVSVPILGSIDAYKFTDSKHLTITTLWGLGFDNNYTADLTGPDE